MSDENLALLSLYSRRHFFLCLVAKEKSSYNPNMDLSLYMILLSCSLGRRVLPKKKCNIKDNL
jgi:hypothetical protein